MLMPRSEGRIELLPADDQADALCQLVNGATRIVRILSDNLKPELFDNAELAEALSRVARHGRQCEVRMLVKDTSMLIKRAHRLGALHRRLPSLVLLRKLSYCPDHYVPNYVLVDNTGVFFIPNEEDKVSFVNDSDRPLVKHYIEQFDDLWQKSMGDPEMRTVPV